MFFLAQYMEYMATNKYMYFGAYIINHLNMASSDIIVMNPTNNKLYILTNTSETTAQYTLDETNDGKSQSPYIYSYPTQYTVSLNRVQLYIKCILLSRYLNMTINLAPFRDDSTL